jgi:hypothetical protein
MSPQGVEPNAPSWRVSLTSKTAVETTVVPVRRMSTKTVVTDLQLVVLNNAVTPEDTNAPTHPVPQGPSTTSVVEGEEELDAPAQAVLWASTRLKERQRVPTAEQARTRLQERALVSRAAQANTRM